MASTPQPAPVSDSTETGEVATKATALVLIALESTQLAHVAFRTLEGELRSAADRFHWNGSEIVICSEGPAAWSGLEASEVAISIGGGDSCVEWIGLATADRVTGVAPEYRAAAVRYLGEQGGNAAADGLAAAVEMHRLFVTPVRRPN